MQAYGTLTIVDLLDTATYIYYADDAEGHNPSASPVNKTYIGIYSGPPFDGFPSKIPMDNWKAEWWSGWSKYAGEDGRRGAIIIKITKAPSSHSTVVEGITPTYRKSLSTVKSEGQIDEVFIGDILQYSYYHYPVIYVDNSYVYCGSRTSIRGATGAAGRGIDHTDIEYGVSENGEDHSTVDWGDTIPTLTQGEYLWIRTTTHYTDGDSEESYSVSYSGIDANTYYIETNQEEILIFKQNVEGVATNFYSPEEISFKIYDNPKQPSSPQIELIAGNFKLELLNENTIEEIGNEYIGLGKTIYTEGQSEIVDKKTAYFNVKGYISNKYEKSKVPNLLIFRFSYLLNEEVKAIKIIPARYGLDEEMATFGLYANGITAAIQHNKLEFTSNGLTIKNKEQTVFWADTEGDLHLKGTLEAGTLKGVTGDFSGEITATSGSIGGLTIKDNTIYNGEDSNASSLKIYGSGSIYAKDITIGSDAKVEDFIKLGEAYIYNPDKNQDKFLEAGTFSLTAGGLLKLGDIEAFGGIKGTTNSSYITAGDKLSSAYWEINGDGTAQFKEIIVDKATIKNSIMEIGTVQAVGSVMLFKDSWKVQSIKEKEVASEAASEVTSKTTYEVTFEATAPLNLKEGDYLTDGKGIYYKVTSDVASDSTTVDLNKSPSVGEILTKIGQNNDFLIAISGQGDGDSSYASKNSLTLSRVNIDDDNNLVTYNRELILGDLTEINKNYGTGLYAENVYLNGTLTTKVGESNYAGINTISGAKANKFNYYLIKLEESEYQKDYYYIINNQGEYVLSTEEYDQQQEYYFRDTSKIVFWAGSTGTGNAIQEAKFQVTEQGSIYAAQGRFEGSLITDSVIKGTSIYTAKIYGEKDNSSVALKIYDAINGIQFIKTRNETNEANEKVQFGINEEGLYTNSDNYVIKIKDGVSFFGNEIKISNASKQIYDTIYLDSNSIGASNKKEDSTPTQKIQMSGNFDFIFDNTSRFLIQNDLIRATSKVNFQENVVFGVENNSLEYQKTANGYNLFVR